MTRLITADEIIALRPCWSDERVRKAVGKGKTARQIASDKRASIADRRWVLCHLLARGPRPNRQALVQRLCGLALRVVDRVTDESHHAACRQAIETAIRWSVGDATADECCAARDIVYKERAAAVDAAAAAAAGAAAAYAAAADYAGDAAAAAGAAYAYAAAYADAAAYAYAAADAAAAAAAYAAADADAAAAADLLGLAAIIDAEVRP